MTSDAMIDADETLGRFMRTLETYDHPAVKQVADTLAESTPLAIEVPDLTTDEWLAVLEATAGELYLAATSERYERNPITGDGRTRWYLRHDGEAFIYGTEKTGELYRGGEDKNAYRQARAVISNHDVTPYPMANYPLEKADSYQEVPADR